MKVYVSIFASAFLALSLSACAGQDTSKALFDAIGAGDTVRVTELLDANAELINRLHRGITPLGVAVGVRKPDIVQFLLNRGADVNAGRRECRPLSWATHNGDVSLAHILVSHGADVETTSAGGCSLLTRCVQQGNVALARLFLEHGARANERIFTGGVSLLFCAVRDNNPGLVQLLLEYGADANERCEQYWCNSVLGLACAYSSPNIVRLLLRYGAERDLAELCWYAFLDGRREIAMLLVGSTIEKGVRASLRDQDTCDLQQYIVAAEGNLDEALVTALSDRRRKLAMLLLGLVIDQGGANSLASGNLQTYLIERNDAKMLSLFLSQGAITNQRGLEGLLKYKLEQGHHNSCCALVDHGVGLSRLSRQQRQRWNGELVRRYERRLSAVAECLNQAHVPADVGHIIACLSGQSKNQMRRLYRLMR